MEKYHQLHLKDNHVTIFTKAGSFTGTITKIRTGNDTSQINLIELAEENSTPNEGLVYIEYKDIIAIKGNLS